MDKPLLSIVRGDEIKEIFHPKGEGYRKSAIARLTRSTSENIVRCQEQKDVIERLKVLALAKNAGHDQSPEFLNLNLTAADNGQLRMGDATDSGKKNSQKRISLSPVVKSKISESSLRKCVTESFSEEIDLESEELSQKPTEKVRRNTISG